jgi:hypothetical protein
VQPHPRQVGRRRLELRLLVGGAQITDTPMITCGRSNRADGRNAARYARTAGPGGAGLKWRAKP